MDRHPERIARVGYDDEISGRKVRQAAQQLFVDPHHIRVERVARLEKEILEQLSRLGADVQPVDETLHPSDLDRRVAGRKDVGLGQMHGGDPPPGKRLEVGAVSPEIEHRSPFIAGIPTPDQGTEQKTAHRIAVPSITERVIKSIGPSVPFAIVERHDDRVAVQLLVVSRRAVLQRLPLGPKHRGGEEEQTDNQRGNDMSSSPLHHTSSERNWYPIRLPVWSFEFSILVFIWSTVTSFTASYGGTRRSKSKV